MSDDAIPADQGPCGAAGLRAVRLAAIRARDRGADGSFVYSVLTTGVYCRPSCPARPAREENIGFHATPAEAERAGYRPCRRCRPAEDAPRHAPAVAAACRALDAAEEAVPLAALAAAAGLSPFHFHRVFKAATGVTPRAYAAARRAERVRAALAEATTITAAYHDAGYGSSSRFYERAGEVLGMSPRAWRTGGEGAAIRFALGECSLGHVLVAATERGVCAITLGDDPEALLADLQARFPRARLLGAEPGFEALVARVVALVERPHDGSAETTGLPLDVRGTAFQGRVWAALRAIPPGTTATYSEIAERIGAPRAIRAVASACANNPVALAIPCHRVVRVGGDLAGYRWGLERKRALLAREAGSAARPPG